jgi:hypothetical protein
MCALWEAGSVQYRYRAATADPGGRKRREDLRAFAGPVPPGPGFWGFLATHIHRWVTVAYFVWFRAGPVSCLLGRRKPLAFARFAEM